MLMAAGTRSTLSDFAENHAVKLTPDEEKRLRGPGRGVNHHFLRAGHPRVLAESWRDFFVRVRDVYGFTSEEDWPEQEIGFEDLFRGFFGWREVRAQFGWVSLITTQRPQHLRSMEDSRIRVTTPNILVGATVSSGAPLKLAGSYPHVPDGFLFHRGDRAERRTLRQSDLLRLFDAPELIGQKRTLIEGRYVPCVVGDEDDAVLKAGRIPSMGSAYYANGFQFGRTGYLNLTIVAMPTRGDCKVLNNTLEIDPISGRIVSIRSFEAPVALGLIGASVVEHFALCECLDQLLDGGRF